MAFPSSGKPYRLIVSLEEASGRKAGRPSSAILDKLKDMAPGFRRTLKLAPIFVDGIAPIEPASTVDFVMKVPSAGGVSWGEAALEFRVLKHARQCAHLVVSVWDYDLEIAQDAFMVTIPLPASGSSRKPCADPAQPDVLLAGPKLTSVSDIFSLSASDNTRPPSDRISIYAFQLPVTTGDSFAFAVLAPANGSTSIRGWRLQDSLMHSFGNHAATFSEKAMQDRKVMKSGRSDKWVYQETSRFIRESLFRAKGGTDESDAEDSFTEIKEFINSRDGVNVVAQLYVPMSREEQGLMFIPFRTMSAANSEYFTRDFRLTAPLPGERHADHDECIARWKIVLNADLSSAPSFQALKESGPKPWRDEPLTDYETTLAFFYPEGEVAQKNDENKGATGLIIAAHYGGGKLGLEGGNFLPVNQIRRRFSPGSAAVLAACETAAPTEANGIINQLRSNGVDTFLASPLKVPTPYAVELVSELVAEIDGAYEAQQPLTLEELFARAMRNVAGTDVASMEKGNLGREYVIVGDASRRLCIHPHKESVDP